MIGIIGIGCNRYNRPTLESFNDRFAPTKGASRLLPLKTNGRSGRNNTRAITTNDNRLSYVCGASTLVTYYLNFIARQDIGICAN